MKQYLIEKKKDSRNKSFQLQTTGSRGLCETRQYFHILHGKKMFNISPYFEYADYLVNLKVISNQIFDIFFIVFDCP